MSEQEPRQLFVVEAARRRVIVSARDAANARTMGAVMLLGSPFAANRDALFVREPEEEERAAFDVQAKKFASDSECLLAAIQL